MKLAVAILNYRTAALTLDAIQSAIDALLGLRQAWRIVVVDNDSQDGSEAVLRAATAAKQDRGDAGWEHVLVLQSGRNGGFGAGNNFAINYARLHFADLEYVYVLNSDAFPERDAIGILVEFLDQHPHYGFAGSYIYGTDGAPHETAFRFPSALGELEGAIRFGPVSKLLKKYQVPIGIPPASCDVDWLAGASLLMRVKTLQEVGVFDETFFLYFEETDLCLRAKRLGWPTRYLLESKVAHVGSASTGMKKWQRIPTYWLDSRRHYFSKNHGAPYFAWATLLRVVGGALYQLRCIIQRKQNGDPKRFIRDLIAHALSRPAVTSARQ